MDNNPLEEEAETDSKQEWNKLAKRLESIAKNQPHISNVKLGHLDKEIKSNFDGWLFKGVE